MILKKVNQILGKKVKFKKKYSILLMLLSGLFIIFWSSLPDPLFDKPCSVVFEDSEGKLLGALIASDEQWRFPLSDKIPMKFETAAIHYEDKNFYYHPGVDPLAMLRAAYQNIAEGEIVSGGSTITMQVIRLSREGKPRTVWEKIIEMILAVRLELTYSKKEILLLYSSNAPFGGNVVGLEAAAWRYFGRSPENLSWAESCLLAVLPNSPSLIHPGRNRDLLKTKRDKLLLKLVEEEKIDSLTYYLALDEPLPGEPLPLPQLAPHLLNETAEKLKAENEVTLTRIRSTLNISLQNKVADIIQNHYQKLSANEIYNAAVIVADVETGDVKSYVGNTYDPKNKNENWVNVVTAPRSTGSILKPILYASMLNSGELLPHTIIPDIPTNIGGFNPQNFNLGFDGAVKADRALARSINVPAVRMLREFRVEKFYNVLKKVGMTSLDYPPDHYGLSLILGGAEATLWNVAGIYASLARSLIHYTNYGGMYNPDDFHELNYIKHNEKTDEDELTFDDLESYSVLNAASIWLTFNAMLDVERPDDELFWRQFSSSQKIAWKTGTSFGFRDGWAIGLNKKYIVAVWTGNADGEGRPGLTGITAAAPILFDIFNILPYSPDWFDQPLEEMVKIETCRKSGYRKSDLCDEVDSVWIPAAGLKFPSCPYHILVHLDSGERYRVSANCVEPSQMVDKSWFVLPPAMEYYYKTKHSDYNMLPPMRSDCNDLSADLSLMDIIYPRDVNKIYIPIELDGSTGSAVFEAAHRGSNSVIFWHLDDDYIGQTVSIHKMPINAEKGWHKLTLVDEVGNVLTKSFEILNEN